MAVEQLPDNPIYEGDDLREAATIAIREFAGALSWVQQVYASSRPDTVVGIGRPPDQ